MDLLRCTFHLNGNSIGTLSCPGVGFFSAFSGNSSATNNPNKTELKDIVPLPCGRYYIILRGRGGTFARFRDDANAFLLARIAAPGLLCIATMGKLMTAHLSMAYLGECSVSIRLVQVG